MSMKTNSCALHTHDETGHGSAPMLGRYYLEHTGSEVLRAARLNLKLSDRPNLRVLHVPKAGSCHLIDPKCPIASQGVADGDKIVVIGPPIFDLPAPLPQQEKVKFPGAGIREIHNNLERFEQGKRFFRDLLRGFTRRKTGAPAPSNRCVFEAWITPARLMALSSASFPRVVPCGT
jgi:hypothetical protein